MTNRLSRVLSAATLIAFSGLGPAAHAALISTGVACNGHGTIMQSDPGYLACSGAWSGNNKNQSADVATQIQSDWGLTGLVDTDVTGGNSGSTGTLTIPDQTGLFVIALKAGDAFSLYEFNGGAVTGGITSISFDTLGVGFFSGHGSDQNIHIGQGLSHADLYAPTSVPEPATLGLLGLGVVASALARRRKAL